MKAKRFKKSQTSGFTLLEVMIAVLIMVIGILGVSSMQLLSFKANQGAYYRSQALNMASDMLERMRNNHGALDSYVGRIGGVDSVPADPGCATSNLGCSPTEIAAEDLRQWGSQFMDVNSNDDFRPTLPNSRAEIERLTVTSGSPPTTAPGNDYSVSVFWSEDDWSDSAAVNGRAREEKSIELTATLE